MRRHNRVGFVDEDILHERAVLLLADAGIVLWSAARIAALDFYFWHTAGTASLSDGTAKKRKIQSGDSRRTPKRLGQSLWGREGQTIRTAVRSLTVWTSGFAAILCASPSSPQ